MSTGHPYVAIIGLMGTTMKISRNTPGAESNRGLLARAYATVQDGGSDYEEKVYIDEKGELSRTMGGDYVRKEPRAYILSTTQIQRGDVIFDTDGTRWEVGPLEAKKWWGSVSHYEANIKQLQEDTS